MGGSLVRALAPVTAYSKPSIPPSTELRNVKAELYSHTSLFPTGTGRKYSVSLLAKPFSLSWFGQLCQAQWRVCHGALRLYASCEISFGRSFYHRCWQRVSMQSP